MRLVRIVVLVFAALGGPLGTACGGDDTGTDVVQDVADTESSGETAVDADVTPETTPDVEPDVVPETHLETGEEFGETHLETGEDLGETHLETGDGRDGRDGLVEDGGTGVSCSDDPLWCETAAECTAFSDYTEPDCCSCDPYNVACVPMETPDCSCFVDPCLGRTADCVDNRCVVL